MRGVKTISEAPVVKSPFEPEPQIPYKALGSEYVASLGMEGFHTASCSIYDSRHHHHMEGTLAHYIIFPERPYPPPMLRWDPSKPSGVR